MNADRKKAIIVGVLFILATVTSIIALVLYQPFLNNPDYLMKSFKNENWVILGALFELILACSAVGTAIMLFPYLRISNESIALGYVCFRFLEVVFIVIGVVSVLTLLTLRHEYVDAVAPHVSSFKTSNTLLIAVHDWTFLLGPNFMLGVNTMMCSYLLYQSKLVPRFIAGIGLIGATLIFIAALLEMFSIILQVSTWGVVLATPIALYEMILAVWLIFKGFNPSAIATRYT